MKEIEWEVVEFKDGYATNTPKNFSNIIFVMNGNIDIYSGYFIDDAPNYNGFYVNIPSGDGPYLQPDEIFHWAYL